MVAAWERQVVLFHLFKCPRFVLTFIPLPGKFPT